MTINSRSRELIYSAEIEDRDETINGPSVGRYAAPAW